MLFPAFNRRATDLMSDLKEYLTRPGSAMDQQLGLLYQNLYARNKTQEFKEEIREYIHDLHSLRPATLDDYTSYVKTHLDAGLKITCIHGGGTFPEKLLFKTDKPSTKLAYGSHGTALNVLVMPGHELRRDAEWDQGRTHNMNKCNPDSWVFLYKDVAQKMIDDGWKFKPEHFGPNCDQKAVTKLLQGKTEIEGAGWVVVKPQAASPAPAMD